MSENKLLSITIPTYSRAKYLEELLESIEANFVKNPELRELVNIYVFDNNSIDNTQEIVENSGLDVIYEKSSIDLDMDTNVNLAYETPQGEYVWLIGDDDFIGNNSIKRIIDTINNNSDLAVILLDFVFLNVDTNKLSENNFEIDIGNDNGNGFFLEAKENFLPISTLIFKKSEWNKHDLTKSKGNQWPHLSALINILSGDSKKSVILSGDLVTIRLGNQCWTENGQNLLTELNLLRIFEEFKKLKYSKNVYEYFFKQKFKDNKHNIRHKKSNDFKVNLRIGQIMAKYFYGFPRFWLRDLPMLLFGGRK